jgi:hypothetical protein
MLAVEFPSPCDGKWNLPVAPSSEVQIDPSQPRGECNLYRPDSRVTPAEPNVMPKTQPVMKVIFLAT